jgi:hypothetical protein
MPDLREQTHLQDDVLVLVLHDLVKVLAHHHSHATISGLIGDGCRLVLGLHTAVSQALGKLGNRLLTAFEERELTGQGHAAAAAGGGVSRVVVSAAGELEGVPTSAWPKKIL